MSLFRKNNQSLQDLVRKLQSPGALGISELGELIEAVVDHPEASPRRLGWMVSSKEPRVRKAGIEFLAKAAPRDVVHLTLAAAIASDSDTRSQLAMTLLATDPTGLRQEARRLFQTQKLEGRRAILEIAALDSEWREWLGIMRMSLRTSDGPLRREAARMVMQHLEDPTVRTIARTLLHDDDDEVRVPTILAFCRDPDPEVVEPFFARLPHEAPSDQERMIGALGELCRKPGIDFESHLFPVMADDSDETRALAMRLVAQVPDKTRVLRNFLVYCRGVVAWLRDRAMKSMLTLGSELTATLAELIRDPDEDIRVAALVMARQLGDKRVLPAVTEVFQGKDDWWIRSIATGIVGQLRSKSSVPLLRDHIQDPLLRWSVVRALGEIESDESTEVLIDCLEDPSGSIRSMAVQGLAGRQSESVVNALNDIAACDEHAGVREKARQVLADLGNPPSSRVSKRRDDASVDAEAEPGLDLQMANPEFNRTGD